MTSQPEPARPSILGDLREVVGDLWRSRELLQQLTLRDLKLRYKQAVMGLGWALFMPLLVILSGTFFRFLVSRTSDLPLDRAAIAAIAVKALPWSFFVGTVGSATNSLTANVQLVTKVYFPREVLPVSATLAHAFDFAVGLAVLVVALVAFHPPPSPAALLWVPPLILLVLGFATACALFLSCANLFFRDVKYIVQVLLTFGVFFTPVFFDASLVGRYRGIVMLNPLAAPLEGLRLAIVQGHNLLTPLASGASVVWQPTDLAYSAAVTTVALVGSALLFHRSEFVFAEYV
ncbi:MAG: O-antigen export system, permease protein [uncultured Gemmatimonadaceae bacterium]|uniref:O-antigen export system, permease protein n=1 Tax=uncultured Gemmatimonadaceae bacterium TaxID=246130 RepID=A0A6J4KK70_9BACT|nr:MAG: O-antigen export system, permease protein [uncultured Gemmatimonadaceae bacterium]